MKYLIVLISYFFCTCSLVAQKTVALTFDDPKTNYQFLDWEQVNTQLLTTLHKHKIKSALFVCGKRIDHPEGKKLLKTWDLADHMICNHTYSHQYYPSKTVSAVDFIADINRVDQMIQSYDNYQRYFRFPYLKEGKSKAKRDAVRIALQQMNYQNGHVSIDASDWYIDKKMRDTLKKNPDANLAPYRDYYIQHILDRLNYYDSLASKVWKKPVRHTLLLHHMLVNGLFLDDLITAMKDAGWKIIDAKKAFKDPIYKESPDILPCGESIVHQLAKASEEHQEGLRYPAEDGRYEKKPLQDFLLNYQASTAKPFFLKD